MDDGRSRMWPLVDTYKMMRTAQRAPSQECVLQVTMVMNNIMKIILINLAKIGY